MAYKQQQGGFPTSTASLSEAKKLYQRSYALDLTVLRAEELSNKLAGEMKALESEIQSLRMVYANSAIAKKNEAKVGLVFGFCCED